MHRTILVLLFLARANATLQAYITGGYNVDKPGRYPFMVSIQVNDSAVSNTFTHRCGGSLVAPRWILTAAHCVTPFVNNTQVVSVLIGALNVTNNGYTRSLDPGAEFMHVSGAVYHESYKVLTSGAVVNDIALLRLPVASMFTPKSITTEDVYKYSDQQIASRQFLNGVIMGWGRMSEYGPLSNTLMNAAMPVVDNDVCLASLLLNGAGTSSEDFSGIVCAHHDSGTVDSCEGDSGGPLMFTTDPAPVFGPDPATRYYHVYAIAGIVSFGKRCEENGEYGAYTRVSQYTGWLAAQGVVFTPAQLAPPAPYVDRLPPSPPQPPIFQTSSDFVYPNGPTPRITVKWFRYGKNTMFKVTALILVDQSHSEGVSSEAVLIGFGAHNDTQPSAVFAAWAYVLHEPTLRFAIQARVPSGDSLVVAQAPTGLSIDSKLPDRTQTMYDAGIGVFVFSWPHRPGGGDPWDIDWGENTSIFYAVQGPRNRLAPDPASPLTFDAGWAVQRGVLFPKTRSYDYEFVGMQGGSGGPEGLGAGAIAGIVIAGVAACALAASIPLIISRERTKTHLSAAADAAVKTTQGYLVM